MNTLAYIHHDAAQKLEKRLDSYANVYTGIGSAIDKRLGGYPIVDYLDYQECANLYRSNDMAARIVDAPAEEMCRRGWFVEVLKNKTISENLSAALEELSAKQHILQSLKWSRLFGGSGIFVGINDGKTADQPVDINNIRSVDFLLPLDPFELIANDYYTDPFQLKYGRPMTYKLNRWGSGAAGAPGARNRGGLAQLQNIVYLGGARSQSDIRNSQWSALPLVHESRIIRFEGVIVNRLQLRENRYWGDSVYIQCNAVLRDFDLSWASASILLQDFAQAVVKLPGFSALLAKNGPIAFSQAAQMVETSRSTARALFLDKEDEFERKATPTTGLPELLQQFSRRLAAAADMPMSRLMGDSPRGFNASGETDETWWYDKIAAKQVDILGPAIKQLCIFLFRAKNGPTTGTLPAPGSWKVKFHPLKQLSDLQESDRRFRIAQSDAVSIASGEFTPEEVALTRCGGDEYDGGKIQLLETDPKARANQRIEMAQKLNPKGAVGASSTDSFDRRKVEAHISTAASNLPPVSAGSGKQNMDSSPAFIPVVIEKPQEDTTDKLADAISKALAPVLERMNMRRDEVDIEIKRDADGRILGLYTAPKKKE